MQVMIETTLDLQATLCRIPGHLSSIGHEFGLKLNQTLVSHSHNFYTTTALAHLIGRNDCRWRVLQLSWCLSFSFYRLQVTLLCQRYWNVAVKVPSLYQITLYTFDDLRKILNNPGRYQDRRCPSESLQCQPSAKDSFHLAH